MPAPDLDDESDAAEAMPDEESDPDPPDDDGGIGFDGTDDSPDDGDFDVGTADLGLDSDGDGGDLVDGFDGFEDSQEDADDSSDSASGGDGGSGGPNLQGGIEQAINEGVASLGAAGLQGREREQVELELEMMAEKMHLGYFGEEVVKKYMETDIQSLPPEYGLAAASVAFAAVVLYKRPDGDDIMEDAVAKVRNMAGGSGSITDQFTSDEPDDVSDDEDDEDDTDE